MSTTTESKDRRCPRDHARLNEAVVGKATLDICGKCQGTFFESGEMLTAFGVSADPASWDRPETGGVVKESKLHCPKCHSGMDAQDVTHEGKQVEVDRCGKCRGVWLDKDEIDTLVAIGHAMQPLLAAERAKAQAELAKLSPDDVTFSAPWKTRNIIALAVMLGVAFIAIYVATRPPKREPRLIDTGTRAKGEEGCPCGCDRSKAMAAALRAQGGEAAPKAIEKALETISARENVGYITERMIQHRLRMLDLADELRSKEVVPPIVAGDPHVQLVSSRNMAAASIPLRFRVENRGQQPEQLRQHTWELDKRIDALLESLAAAATYQERQPIKRELYALGKNAIPHLESIAIAAPTCAHGTTSHHEPETRRLARSTLQLIKARIARDEASVVGEDQTLRVSAELLVHGERIEIVDNQEKLITSSFRLWLSIENLTDQRRTLRTPSVRAYDDEDEVVHFPVSRWYEEDGEGQSWDGVLPPKAKVLVNVIGDIPDHVKPGTKTNETIEVDGLAIKTTTEARAVIHVLHPE